MSGFSQDFALTVTGNRSLTLPETSGDDDEGGDDDDSEDLPGGDDNCLPAVVDADLTVGGTCTTSDDVTVTKGATLTVAAGTTIMFWDGHHLKITPGARLLVEGTAEDKVVFDAKYRRRGELSISGWGGIRLHGQSRGPQRSGHSRLEHFELAGISPFSAGVLVKADSVRIENAFFHHNGGQAIRTGKTSDGEVSSLTIVNATFSGSRGNVRARHASLSVESSRFLRGSTLHVDGEKGPMGPISIADNLFDQAAVWLEDTDEITMRGNTIKNLSEHSPGVWIADAEVDVYRENTIENSGYGIVVYGSSMLYMDGRSRNLIRNSKRHEIDVRGGARVYLGDVSIDGGGYNEIYDENGYGLEGRYVHNGAGAPLITAEMNDWHDEPSERMFEGPVDYTPHADNTSAPLSVSLRCYTSGVCDTQVSGGGGDYNYGWNHTACNGQSYCRPPCGGRYVRVLVTGGAGEEGRAWDESADCPLGGEGADAPVAEPFATIDAEALANEIDAAAAALGTGGSPPDGPAAAQATASVRATATGRRDASVRRGASTAQQLQRLYGLLLLQSRVDAVRAGHRGERGSAFAGDRAEPMHALFAGYADAPTRRAARQILIEDRLRSGRPDQALQKVRQYTAGLPAGHGTAWMQIYRAQAFEQKGQFEKALGAVDRAEKLHLQEGRPHRYAHLRGYLRRRSGTPIRGDAPKRSSRPARAEKAARAAEGEASLPARKRSGPLPETFVFGAPYPNPARAGQVTLPLHLPARARVHAGVYDMLGRQVKRLPDKSYAAGRATITFDAHRLSSGLYLIRVRVEAATGETRTFTRGITIVR